MKKALIFLLFIGITFLSEAQLLKQDFNSSANLDDYTSFIKTNGSLFNGIGFPNKGGVVSVNSNKLSLSRINRSGFFVRQFLGYNYQDPESYGALISTQGANSNTFNLVKNVANLLGTIYIRTQVVLSDESTWGKLLYDNGFKIALNVNYGKVDNPDGTRSPVPFPTDTADYKIRLGKLLDLMQPEVISIENEEPNTNYHSGSVIDYLNELRAGTNVAHSRGFKVMNGGITAEVLRYVTYSDYLRRGKVDSAASFKNRTLNNTHYNRLSLQKKGLSVDSLIEAYHDMPIDYVNFHWYGGDGRGSEADILKECINFLIRKTGKPIISNETGQYDTLPQTVTSILETYHSYKFPYVMWYSGDGDPALALHNNTKGGSIRNTGEAFRDFLKANGLSYEAPQFVSMELKLEVSGATSSTTNNNCFALGESLGNNSDDYTLTDVHSRFGVDLGAIPGTFQIRDIKDGITSPTYSGEKTIKWYVNNSDMQRSYLAPDGSTEIIANDTWDLWVDGVKVFDDKACLHGEKSLRDFKFLYNLGTSNITIDDVLIKNELDAALPIKLVSFDGRTDGNTIVLNWITSSEGNNSHFELFKLKEENHFERIDSIMGKGKSDNNQYYSTRDNSPINGMNYYLLKQVDFNNLSTDLGSLAIDFGLIKDLFAVYVAPEKLSVKLFYNSKKDETIKVAVYTVEGKKLMESDIMVKNGFNTVDIPVKLLSGIHILKLHSSEGVKSKKF